MMNKISKKGFTLVEMLGVISLIAILMFLIVPSTASIIKKNKEKAFDIQIKSIEAAAVNWGINNMKDLDKTFQFVTLNQLKKEKLIDENVIDPRTDKCISNDVIIGITANLKEFSAKVNLDTYKTSESCETNSNNKKLLYNQIINDFDVNIFYLNYSYEVMEVMRKIISYPENKNYAEDRNISSKNKFFNSEHYVKIYNKLYKIINMDELGIYIRYVKNCESGTCISDKSLESKSYYGLGASPSSIVTSWDDPSNQVKKDIDNWYSKQNLDEYTIPLNLINSYDIDKDGLTSRNLKTNLKERYNFLTAYEYLIITGGYYIDPVLDLHLEFFAEINNQSGTYTSTVTYNKDGKVALEQIILEKATSFENYYDMWIKPTISYCTSSSCNANKLKPVFNLRPDIKYVSGTGTEADPYIVEP